MTLNKNNLMYKNTLEILSVKAWFHVEINYFLKISDPSRLRQSTVLK